MSLKIEYSPEIKYDLDHYLGKPSVCKIKITDLKANQYSAEIFLGQNWKMETFTKAIKEAYSKCEYLPVILLVESFNLDLIEHN